MSKEGHRYHKFSRRAFLLTAGQGMLMSALGARLYYLSVVKGKSYQLQADKNRISVQLIAPSRGEILDRHAKILAANKQDFRVILVPEQAEDIQRTLEKIRKIIPISARQVAKIKRTIKRQRKFVPVVVAKGLSWNEFAKLNVKIPKLEGIRPDAGQTRDYPFGGLAAHIVGYVGRPREEDLKLDSLLQLPDFKIGREGIERYFEEDLRGKAGTRRVEVNAFGREIRELKPKQEAITGKNIKLTLDVTLQEQAVKALGEEAAAAVVMKAKTGEILTMASNPAFNPNEFNEGISHENWTAILADPRKPLLNKAVSGRYPPGSTVKMIVALAALEKGLITEHTKVFCDGKHKFGDRVYHCWEQRGHGYVDLQKAIAKSCDVYFYKLAEQLDIDDLSAVCKKFGLGQRYDLGIPGIQAGLLPTKAWKKQALGSPWYQGETLNVSIGQGAMTATPLELAVMTARIATGKAVKPKLLMGQNDTIGERLDVNPIHLRLLKDSMHQVMLAGGTAHDYKNPKDSAKIAGKTGTAQVRTISRQERKQGVLKNEVLAWKQRDHALFVGYAPFDDPEYVVSVLVQHGGGGSSVAAPIGRTLLLKAMDQEKSKDQAHHDYSQTEVQNG